MPIALVRAQGQVRVQVRVQVQVRERLRVRVQVRVHGDRRLPLRLRQCRWPSFAIENK